MSTLSFWSILPVKALLWAVATTVAVFLSAACGQGEDGQSPVATTPVAWQRAFDTCVEDYIRAWQGDSKFRTRDLLPEPLLTFYRDQCRPYADRMAPHPGP